MPTSWPARRSTHPRGILIIEDDAVLCRTLCKGLQLEAMRVGDTSCEVSGVVSLAEAKARLAQVEEATRFLRNRPVGRPSAPGQEAPTVSGRLDCVVLDLNLDDSGGLDTLDRLRAFTALPVVILTGLDDPKDNLAVEAVRRGARDFIAKPPEFPRLYRTLRLAIVDHERELARAERAQLARAGGT